MRKIRLHLSYDGTPFQGWQKQPGRPTVQGALETALSQIYSEPIRTIGSGRTDAGTHAVGQVAHFEAPKIITREENLMRSLNALLPNEIVVKSAWLAPEEFHALASARRKTYIYRIWNHPVRSPLWHSRSAWISHPLNLELLNEFAQFTVGKRDFKSFQSQGTPVKSTIRHIDLCLWTRPHPHLLQLTIRGNGFLKQMVRNLVGTYLYLERNNGTVRDLATIFDARDRQAAKATAEACGLYLYRVEYPSGLDKKCRKL